MSQSFYDCEIQSSFKVDLISYPRKGQCFLELNKEELILKIIYTNDLISFNENYQYQHSVFKVLFFKLQKKGVIFTFIDN